jgi:plasmid stabilization system protein ParE
MNYQLVFTAKADQDLTKIKIWYNGISIKLTQELFSELGKELNTIKKEPLLYQTRYKTIRIAFIVRFEYGIHFVVKNDTIVILRILHNKQYFNEKS